MDGDDEVRDRALLYLEILKQKQKALSSRYILSGDCHMTALSLTATQLTSQVENSAHSVVGEVKLSLCHNSHGVILKIHQRYYCIKTVM